MSLIVGGFPGKRRLTFEKEGEKGNRGPIAVDHALHTFVGDLSSLHALIS